MKLKPIEQQVVVVMGASTGIGRLTAKELARRGAKVVVSARGAESLEELVEEIRAAGGEAIAAPADISVAAEVQAVADHAEEIFGGIDTWVNMAATSVYAPFEQTTPEEFRRVISVNLIGYANGAWAALPALKRRGGGALVNVSSVEARVALPFHSAYAASKHGIAALTDTLRIELRHEGAPVSVTNVMPASIDTPFFDHARTKLGVKPRPAPPVYGPEKVVGAVLYAATHPIHELVVGGAGRAMIGTRLLAPRLLESMLSRVGFTAQKTDQQKSIAGPDALMAPMDGDTRIRERIDAPMKPVRQPSFFSRHPRATFFGIVAALAAAPSVRARFAAPPSLRARFAR